MKYMRYMNEKRKGVFPHNTPHSGETGRITAIGPLIQEEGKQEAHRSHSSIAILKSTDHMSPTPTALGTKNAQ